MFPFPFALFSKAGTLSQIYKFPVGRERVFFGSFFTLFVDQREAAVRERQNARQMRRNSVCRDRDIAVAKKLKHGSDKVVRTPDPVGDDPVGDRPQESPRLDHKAPARPGQLRHKLFS